MSKQYCPIASLLVNPVIDSAALLRNVIFLSRSIVKMPSLMLFRMLQHGIPGLNALWHDEFEPAVLDSKFLRSCGIGFPIGINFLMNYTISMSSTLSTVAPSIYVRLSYIVFFHLFIEKGSVDTKDFCCFTPIVIGCQKCILDSLNLCICMNIFQRSVQHIF